MDRFHEMRAFVAVADAGSFVRGAEAMGASKTAASRLIADLEAVNARAVDPENRLLWRMNRRRLSAEAISDAILAVNAPAPSGSLITTPPQSPRFRCPAVRPRAVP